MLRVARHDLQIFFRFIVRRDGHAGHTQNFRGHGPHAFLRQVDVVFAKIFFMALADSAPVNQFDIREFPAELLQ